MATYPTLPTSFGSDPDPLNSLDIDRAEDGTGRARSHYVQDKVKIKISHPYLDSAQKLVLDTFYNANRLLTLTYVSPTDGITRTCVFSAPVSYKREYGEHWTATVNMEQV